MKRKNNNWLNIVFLLIGALISYILCQFNYLEIDAKINVSTSLISIATATIALYLAISLKKNQTKSSNLHSYLQPKLDVVWKLFLTLSHQISLNDSIELSVVTKSIKEIYQNITPLKKMFKTFDLEDSSIDNLETEIENLEFFLVDECQINENIINYSTKKEELRNRLDEVHSLFVISLKAINKIS
jgi:hypothetical protein